MFGKLRRAVEAFGYLPYDGPLLESFDLYASKSGQEIVNTQLYHFTDRGERHVAIRPEMTPTLARMVAAKVNEIPRPIRWFSIPNLWRYERPQRGRLREHWQLNVDLLGGDPLAADLEILEVAHSIISAYAPPNSRNPIEIRINHRGLMDAFFSKDLGLSSIQALACTKAIDLKDKIPPETFSNLLHEAGLEESKQKRLLEFFTLDLEEWTRRIPCKGAEHLSQIFRLSQNSALKQCLRFDPSILRGLDYYTGLVFEIYDTHPENRRALFGGGRYDELLGLFGKENLSGVGFGMGDAGLENFLETHGWMIPEPRPTSVFLGVPSTDDRPSCQALLTELRKSGVTCLMGLQSGGIGAQLKAANKLEATWAILWGEEERTRGLWILKNLKTGEQQTLDQEAILKQLTS